MVTDDGSCCVEPGREPRSRLSLTYLAQNYPHQTHPMLTNT